jgi:Cu/Ag efflux pump CusA
LVAVIEKLPGANTLEVTRGVEAALEALRPGMSGVEMDATVFRSASFIETAFRNLRFAVLVGAVLMVLVLGAMLYNWRAAVVAIVTVPLSLVAALVVMRDLTFNTMILVGLVIALVAVVDDAIVSVESIVRRLRQQGTNGSEQSRKSVIVETTLEMRGPMLNATLIIVLAALPIFLIEGLAGAFLRPLALSLTMGLAAAMLVALVVTPSLGLMLLKHGPDGGGESPLVGPLRRAYERVLDRTVSKPRTALATVIVLAVAVVGASPFLGQSLLPPFKETYLLVDWAGAPGTSHPEMVRVMDLAASELRGIPGVDQVHCHMGRAVTGDQIVGMHASQLWIKIGDEAEYDETLAAVQQTVDGYPGLVGEVQTYLARSVREVLTGASESIVVRLYGDERHVLATEAEKVRHELATIDGIVDLQIEGQLEQPQIEIEVDLARAEPHAIKPGDVRRAAATHFAGLEVGFLFEEQKVFNVVVWGTPETRQSVPDVRNLLINTANGRHVRLGDVADVRIRPTPTVIHHEGISPRVDVVANVRGRSLNAVADEVENRLAGIEFPLEYYPELLGEYAEREAAEDRVLSAGIAAALGILLLLQAAFRSWRLASLFFLCLPLAMAGGVVAVLIDGGTVSLGSLVGFLAVLAIAVRNGIALIRHYQDVKRREDLPFGKELVERGTRERFAPIVTSALTIAAAMLPFVFLGNVAGLEFVRPVAVVTLGGLVTATLLNLHIVPALYLGFGDGAGLEVDDLHMVVARGHFDATPQVVPGVRQEQMP